MAAIDVGVTGKSDRGRGPLLQAGLRPEPSLPQPQ
mgnify:CR=1 FL=1